jgi:hypothetical protein
MKTQGGNARIVGSLERTEKALQQILKSVTGIDKHLQQVEARLGSKQTTARLDFIPGSANTLVYSMGGKIHGDPIGDAIRKLRGTGERLPSFILGSDRSETEETCSGVLHLVRSKVGSTRSIIGLRWSNIPSPLNINSVIIGTRFALGPVQDRTAVAALLEKAGMQVVDDDGEFGGGRLAYSLVRNFSDSRSITILELTLDKAFVADQEKMREMLRLLAEL